MEEQVFKSTKSNLFSNTLRFIFGGVGLIYLFLGVSVIYPDWTFETSAVINTVLGLAMIVAVLINPTFGANIELTINDEFLRTTEDVVLTRTVYWHKLDKIVLKQFSLGIYYKSGASEKFRLPYLNSDEFEELRNRISQMGDEHHFKIEEKSWWNVF